MPALFFTYQRTRQLKPPFFIKLTFFWEKRDSKETHKCIICQVGGLGRTGSSMQKFDRRGESSPEGFLGGGKSCEATMCLAC